MFVEGSPPISPELQKKFDYGTKNEVNATATLITTVVPAYLPACYAFYEVGPASITTADGKKLLEVSADGILQCSFGENCPNFHIHGNRRILVETKSPVPQENIAETIFYDVPARYVPQVQSQLKAYLCDELWFVCSTAVSATVIVVYFDEQLWDQIWSVVVDLYWPETPKIPTHLHPLIKELRFDISKSKERHTSFLCEVPTITGEYGSVTIPENFSSPYAPAPGRENLLKTNEMITQENFKVSVDAKSALQQCHQVLRQPGKELLVFMLTDKDRKQSNNVPYSYPVAYAMKGGSMTNKHLSYLVNKVRTKLLQRNIPVLCEAYDGQWHKFITRDTKGNSLTKLHGKENWSKFSNMSKDKCIEEVASLSVVKKSTQELLKNCKLKCGNSVSLQEIRIEKDDAGHFFLSSEKGKMNVLHSVHPASRPDLYSKKLLAEGEKHQPNTIVVEEEKYLREADGFKVKRKRKYQFTSIFATTSATNDDKVKKRTRIVGLQDNEQNLFAVISANRKKTNEDDNELQEEEVDVQTDVNTPSNLEEYLRSDQSLILHNILNELQNSNSNKWQSKTIEDLYPNMLTTGSVLLGETTVKELNIICMELRCLTGRNWASSNMLKAEIVNILVKAFGGDSYVEVQRRKKKSFNPETLITSCVNYIKTSEFPIQHIQIPLASLCQIENREKWIRSATVPLYSAVPNQSKDGTKIIPFFSYPALSPDRKQIEFRTFDFTHILTNLRTQILTRGFDFCRKEHFEHLSTHKPGLLSLALVFEKTDQQNAFTAMRMFNYDVERYMRENGFTETANFIKIVRNWHDACNRRGIPADTRVSSLVAMHDFLTEGINFDSVPFQYPGRYIKGLTWQTYEAILQMISTRIQLYNYSYEGSYNSRAVSTLSNESFFSDLVRYDKESHGYPKGTNVSQVFGRVVLINHFKHKRDKNYYLAATIKCKYEVKLAEANYSRLMRENAYHFQGMFRDHYFDFPNQIKSKRVRRDDITTGLDALRTSGGVRRYYKTIEADLLSEIRGGNKIKGFDMRKNVY